MKKKVCKILCLVSGGVFLALALIVISAMRALANAPTIGIIGGADGPTAMFLTSRLMPYPLIAAVALIICIITGAIWFAESKKA